MFQEQQKQKQLKPIKVAFDVLAIISCHVETVVKLTRTKGTK